MQQEIKILYFAVFQDLSKKTQETMLLTNSMTPRTLYHELAQKYAFSLPVDQLRFAVNHRFIPADTPLQPGDIVALIPPVSGG